MFSEGVIRCKLSPGFLKVFDRCFKWSGIAMFSSRPENALRDRIDQIGTASHVSGWKGIRSARGPKRPRWDLFYK